MRFPWVTRLVIFCARDTVKPYAILQHILGKLDLKLNEDKSQIRDTRREMIPVPIDVVVGKLNQTTRGWSNYFHYGHGHRKLKSIKYYMEARLRNHLRYRYKVRNLGAAFRRFPSHYIYDDLKLYKMPTAAA